MSRAGSPIVVGGCLRSGTSLVRRILDAHPRIHCGPEVPFFRDFYGDYRDDRFAHLRFSTTARSILPEVELLDVLGRAFVEVHERAAARVGKARWADKAPENVLYLEQWQRLLGDSWYMIHVVRNPLDTLASMEGRFPLTLPTDLEGRIVLYRRYVEAGLDFGLRHPRRCRTIVYEALCESPETTVTDLMTWLGEGFHPDQLAFNDVPHELGLEDPNIARTACVHQESVGQWASVLDDDAAAVVWSETHDLWARVDPAGRHLPTPLG